VARRPAPDGPGWEVLVKWTGLPYEHCTWEVRRGGLMRSVCRGLSAMLLSGALESQAGHSMPAPPHTACCFLSSLRLPRSAACAAHADFPVRVCLCVRLGTPPNRRLISNTPLCTQVEGDGVLMSPRYLELHRELWARQQAALRRAQPEVVQQAAAAKQVCCGPGLAGSRTDYRR